MTYNPPHKNKAPVADPSFTKKETLVVILICRQYSNKEIAHRMDMSVRTVECHKKNMMKKTGSRNMVGIAMFAVKKEMFLPAILYLMPALL